MRETALHLERAAIGLLSVAVVSTCALNAPSASADQEAPALYDARSAAMGGAGAAFIDSGAALYHNPANMEMYERTAVTLTFTPAFAQVSAPFAGPGSEEKSTRGFAPLFLIGGGYRVQDRIVLGLGVVDSSFVQARDCRDFGERCTGASGRREAPALRAVAQSGDHDSRAPNWRHGADGPPRLEQHRHGSDGRRVPAIGCALLSVRRQDDAAVLDAWRAAGCDQARRRRA